MMREAIILAGGQGTRLRQAVPNLPKPMAPIAGTPFLEILLSHLERKQFKHAILSLGFMADTISTYFGSHYGAMKLSYVIEEHPLGTGGAIRLAMEHCSNNHIFIFNGDTFLDLEVDEIEKQWELNKNPIIVGREVTDTSRYGRLLIANNKICGFSEKGASGAGLINAGSYVFNRGQLDSFPLYHNFSLEKEFLEPFIKTNPMDIYITNGHFIDIGIPEDYERAQNELKPYLPQNCSNKN